MDQTQKNIAASVGVIYFVLLALSAAAYIILQIFALKAVASALFAAGALAFLLFACLRREKGYHLYKYLILLAALFCLAGDAAIDSNTIVGIILFAVGNILYIAAFQSLNCVGWSTVIPAAALFIFCICWILFLIPPYVHLGALAPAIIIYAAIICVMFGRALGVLFDNAIDIRVRVCVFLGALLFAVSDVFLTQRDYSGSGEFTIFVKLNLMTYYPAQYFLTFSALLASFSGGRRIKAEMNVFRRLYCRAFQFAFKLVIPILPYRQPKPLADSAEAAELLISKNKRRALIVTDPNIYRLGLCAPICEELSARGLDYCIYSDTVANPTTANCEAAAKLFKERECDCMIAVGGGSAMDCAKGAGALIIKPKRTLQQMRGVLKVFGRLPLFIAVPTTAGTGSETTIAAVIVDDKTRDKFTVISFCLAPHYAILDPLMTVGLPPSVTATTGMDALTHAVEAYIGGSTTRLTRRLAVEAVKIIRANLYAAYSDGKNEYARRRMQYAAYCAGLSFTISYVGYVHAVAHSLGGKYNTPHGLANAVILPYVLRGYGPSCRKRLARLARKSGVADIAQSDEAAADRFISFVEELNRSMDIPAKLKVEAEDIPELSRHADREANPLYPVPRLMNAAALEEIYYEIKK